MFDSVAVILLERDSPHQKLHLALMPRLKRRSTLLMSKCILMETKD